ncbi:hypothetical protein [Companilactobacillus zhongbaensis]|uniref:hypothetical protein n=1 Tax=Companilactobacillus zhongbaensis TaxID=2486009 RepID=UPI000F7958BE|nr:hypothetical protein [Companilactobacillus zhongbaensis]
MFPLVLNTLLGVAELLSILPVLLLALPVALIQAALLLGLFALPVVIFNVLNLLPALIVGLSSLIIINWFFGSVAFQLLTNPIEDLKTFIVLLYTMVTEPVFYWAFIWITLPMTIGAFLGAFVNWLNPLNWIFKAISAFTIIGIPITVLLSILDIDIIRVLALLTTLPIVGIPVAALLGIAKLLLLNLINIYFLNSFIASLPVVIEPWVALAIIFIDDLVGGILSLGISVPDILLTWGMLIPAVAFPVLFVVLGLTIMLSLDAVVTLLAIPLIAPLINISLLILALGFNPLLALIGVNLFTTIGITSIVLAIAGLFTLAYTWMPFSFNALAFLVYFIFVNPGFYAIIQGSLVPAIGAIGLIIGGVLHWIIGNFGTGLITANSFAIFAHVAFTAVLSLAIGVIELISVLPVALIALPLAIIQSLLLLGLFALPVVLFNLAIFLPALIIGAAGMLAAFWFFGSAFFQLLTNPIQDLKALVVLVYTMITEPIFYWGFQFITIPMTFGAFIGTFLNWVNPLNYIFKAISAFAILGTPIVELNSFLALELLRFGSLLTLLPIFGIPAFLGLTIAKRMLVRLLVLFVLNTFLATVPVVLEPWVALVIIVIDDVVGGILSLGISVPDILLTWGMLIPAIAFPVLFAVQGVGIMLGFDIIDILIFAPLILIPMIFGLFNAILANPLLAIITKLFFDFQGIVSIGLLLAGIFTLSYIWLPMTFNGLAFAIYFIFGNPGFYAIIQGSLVPAIGAIGLIIAGILHWVIGNFGTGLVTANSFALFVHLMFPLVLTTVIGILELVSSLALSIFAPLLPLIALGVLGLVVLPLVLSIYAAFKAFQTLLILISLAPFLIPLVGLTLGLLAPIFPLLLLILIPLQLLFDVGVWLLFRGLNNLLSLLNGLIKQIVVNTIGSFIPTLLMKLALLNSLMLHLFAGLMNLIPGLLHKLFTIPLWLLSGLRFLTSLLTVPVLLLDMLNNFIASLVWNFITSLASFLIKNLIWIKLFKLLNKLVGLLLRPILLVINIAIPLLALPIIKFIKALRNAIIAGLLSFLIPFIGAFLIIPTAILDGLRFIIDDVILGLLLLPGLIPFRNLLLDALFLIPALLNFIALNNLLRTPLKWIHDLFWQLALPLAVLALTFAILIPFFGLMSLLNPLKWLRMALLSALTTFNVQLLTTLIVLPLKLLNNKLLSLLPALLNGLLLGFLRNILGGLPLDVLGLLALPLLNILGLIGTLTPGLRLLGLPLLLLTQLLGLPLLLDSLRNLIAPLLWGLLAGLLTYPLVKLAKNVIDIALLPLLGLLSTLPIFLLKLFNKAFVLRPLLLLGLPLLAQLLTGLALPLFNLIRRAIKLGLNLLKGAIALLTMPLWLGLPALNLLREALILPVLLLTLLRGLRNIFRLLGFPLLLLALPLLAGLATLLLGLPLITLLNKLLSMPLLALLLPLLAALPILPIKILLDLLLLPLVLLGNKLLGLPAALLAGLLLPLLLGRMIRHLIKLPLDLLKLAGLVLFNLLLPFIPFLNLLTPLLWPLGLLLQPLALADVLRDLLGNLPFDLLNLLLILPLAQILSTLAMLIPGLGLLLIPFLLPLKLFNRFIAIPLALVRTLGDLAKALLLGLPLALLGTLLAFPLINLLNDILSLALLPLLTGLLTLPLFLLNLGLLTLLTFPIAKGVLPFLIANGLSALVANFLPVLAGLLLNPVIVLANGIRLFNDFVFGLLHLGAFLLLTLPGLIPFRNLLLNALFFIPLLLNLISLFNLLRTPLKWILDLFNQLALPLAAMALTFAILIPFFGLISLLNPFKWLRMALLSALTTFNVQLLSTLFLLPLKLLNNKLLSLLPALLNGLLLGFLRNILGGLPLDILGLLALPLLNLLALAGVLTPGLRLLALPLLLLTQLLGLPLLLDTLRNLIAPLLWGNLAGLLTYPIAKLIKNELNLLGLPLLGLLATLPIFLLKLFNKAFVLRPLLLLGLPLLAGLLTGLVLPLFNLIRRAIKLGLNLLKNALALLTMPLWLGLPALNLLREALILPVLLLTLLRGLRNLFNTFLGLPGLLLGLPLLAGLATFLLGLPLITLLNMLLSMPLLALLLPLLAALPILPIKILLDLLLLPLVLLGNKLLGLPMAILAGLLLPLVLNGLFKHFLKLPFDLLKLLGLGLFNLLLPFIPLLNLLAPLLLPLGLLLMPLALADVLRDILGNLPFDLLNLLLILPLVQLLSTLAMLIPGLGLLLIPLLLPLKLFNRFIAIPLAFLRTLGDLAKLLLLALPLALLTTLLSLPLINLLNDALSLLLLPLLSGLLTLPLFLLNLGLATLLTFPIAKGVLPFLIANGLSALVANFLPVLIGLLLNPILVLANGLRLFNDFIKTLGKFLLLGALALPGLIPLRNLILDGLFFVPALINGLSLLNLLSLPFKFLRDLIKNNVLPLLVAGLTNLLLLPIFGPLQFLNPINWIKVPLLAALRTFTAKLLAKLFLVPGLILLNLLTSLIPATLAAIVVPFLRGLLGGLPLDILGLLGLPLLNLLALLGTFIPGVRLLALPLLLLTQLLGLPLLLDTLRNLIAPLLWGALAGLLTYPIANLVKDLLGLIGLPLLGLLTTLPLFFFKLLKNVLLGNVLALGLPLLNQALTLLALVPFNLLKAGLKLLNSLLPLGLVLLTMPLWFNLPLLNILRRVAFWLLLGLELLTLPFKLLRNLLRTFVGLPMLLLGLPLLAGLLNFLFILPLVTLATMLLALPLPLTLLLPLLALLGNLPIKLLTDLLLLPLMFLINGLLALPLAAILGNLLPLVLGALNGLIKLPFDLLGLLGLPLLLRLLDLGKLFALLNPLLWPLLPIINVLRNVLRMLIPFKLADVLKDILGPLSALPIDTLLALAIPALGLLTLLTMLNPIFWPLLPVLLPLALTLGLVGTPIALLRVLKDLAKLALPVLATMLLFPIIHTGFNILGLLALPLISGLLTLPLFLLNLGLKTLLTLPIVKSILPILINLGILLPLTTLPALLLAPIFLLGNLVKGLRLLGDILATLLALPGVLKDLFDLVILPLKILIKPLLVLGLPLLAKVLTFLALSPLMLLNNLLAHLLALPLVGLVGLGNALLPLLVPFLFMNLLVRPLMIPGLMLLNGVILPTLLKLAIAIPVLGLLALPFLIGALTLPLFLLSLPIPLLNMGLQLLSLGMIIPGLLMVVGGVIALPFGLLGSLGGAGTPGTVIPGTPGTTPDEGGNVVPEPGYAIRQIPSVGFWVHNDPLVL